MNQIDVFEKGQVKKKIFDFRPGDTVRVHIRVVEGERERIQVFQGTVIKRQGKSLRETFTVRKISFGVGVERTFLVHSPMVAKVEIRSRGHVRRAKLYYLRERVGKKARIKERARVIREEASEETSENGEKGEDSEKGEKSKKSREEKGKKQ